MKKVVMRLDLHDTKGKQKAMKTVSTLSGVDSIAMDMKERKLTVIGDVDPVVVVGKLRKAGWHTEILSVGPAKEEKKDEGKKDGGKKEEDKKNPNDQIAELVKDYKAYNPHLIQYYYVVSYEESSNACVIC